MTLKRSGGQILVDQLAAQGVEHVFCVPGESYLAVLDALARELRDEDLAAGAGLQFIAQARIP